MNPLMRIKWWIKVNLEEIILTLCLAPALALLAIFQFIPAILTVWFSLTDIALLGEKAIRWNFLGLENYINMARDKTFWISTQVTAQYCIISLIIRFAMGLIAALYLTSKIKGKRIMAALFLLPYIIPGVIHPYVWMSMLEPREGVINTSLRAVGLPPQSWTYGRLTDSIIAVNCWAGYAFAMLVLTSALASIPKEYYEIAEIHGVSRWFKFKKITLPLIKFPLILCLIMIFKEDIDDFTIAYMFTGGEPYPNYKTELLSLYAYHEAFHFWELGYGSAVGFIIAIIVFVLTLAQLRVSKV